MEVLSPTEDEEGCVRSDRGSMLYPTERRGYMLWSDKSGGLYPTVRKDIMLYLAGGYIMTWLIRR